MKDKCIVLMYIIRYITIISNGILAIKTSNVIILIKILLIRIFEIFTRYLIRYL